MPTKFDVLDDLTIWPRVLLLLLCTYSCCWGFVNNTILLVFASKVGFPLAVVSSAMSLNFVVRLKQMMLYTTIIIISSALFFYISYPDIAIAQSLTKNFVPSWMDAVLAIGLGWALSKFWLHGLRINIVVASAGLSSLLPACVMASYMIIHNQYLLALDSLSLYAQYVFGMAAGALINKLTEQ